MEKGSFQTSVQSVLEMDEIAKQLPLPNQMPRAFDPARLPAEALRSSAVETLLGQNADLMARLGVSLRHSGTMETKIVELEKENQHLRHRLDASKDQLLVVQEKERLLSDRTQQMGTDTATLQQRLSTLERRYADTYTHAQGLERQMRSLRNYRFRMQRVTEQLHGKAQKLIGLLNGEASNRKSVVHALDLAQEQLRNIQNDNSDAQMQLVSKYEGELASLRADLELTRRKAADRDVLYEAKVRIENQLVFEERQNRQYRDETQRDLQSTKEENHDLRGQLKTRLIEIDRYEREILAAVEKLENFEVQEKEKIDQIESLQLLWKEQQTEIERLEEKNRALQKLNQQLSVTLNSQRKEIFDLKSDLEKEKFSGQEKVKAFELQLKK